MKRVKCTNLRNIYGQLRFVWSSRLAIVWPEFRQSSPWKCSVSRLKWYKAQVAVTEKFSITHILNAVTQLQLEFCKSIQRLFKYSTNKNHHNFLQKNTISISTSSIAISQPTNLGGAKKLGGQNAWLWANNTILFRILPLKAQNYYMFRKFWRGMAT